MAKAFTATVLSVAAFGSNTNDDWVIGLCNTDIMPFSVSTFEDPDNVLAIRKLRTGDEIEVQTYEPCSLKTFKTPSGDERNSVGCSKFCILSINGVVIPKIEATDRTPCPIIRKKGSTAPPPPATETEDDDSL